MRRRIVIRPDAEPEKCEIGRIESCRIDEEAPRERLSHPALGGSLGDLFRLAAFIGKAFDADLHHAEVICCLEDHGETCPTLQNLYGWSVHQGDGRRAVWQKHQR